MRSSTKRACAAIESTTSSGLDTRTVQPVGAGLAPWNSVHLAADLGLNGASASISERAAQTAQSPQKNRRVRCRPPEMESARFVWRPSRCTSSRFAATSFAHRAAGRPPTGTATSMRIIGAAFAGKRTWPGQARNVNGGWERSERETSRAFLATAWLCKICKSTSTSFRPSQRPAPAPRATMLSFESFRFTGNSPGKRPSESPATPSPKRAALVVAAAGTKVEDLGDEIRRDAFVAPAPARWRERYAPVCAACEAARATCTHTRERPLRLLVCGHNPSDHSWDSGWSYSNPSNNFWKLLVRGEIIPSDWTAEDCPRLQENLGIGFTDAGTVPGNDASKYGRAVMLGWREDLYARMRGHLCRVAICEEEGTSSSRDSQNESKASTSIQNDRAFTLEASVMSAEKGFGPTVVAFAGKRQYGQLFDSVPKKVQTGLQDPDSLPPNWPFLRRGPGATEVWVLPSSSGRAAMTKEAREWPYVELGDRLREVPWPRRDQ